MGQFRFEHPAELAGGTAHYIDLRVEDWELQSRELRHYEEKKWHDAIHLKKVLPASQFATIPSFYGRVPDGPYVYHRKGDIGILMVSPSKPADKDAINLDELPLKKHWWDYAEVVSAGSEDLEFTDAGNVRLKTPGRGRAAVDRYGKPVEV